MKSATAPARRASSSNAAERFAARIRSRRRRRLASLIAVVAVVALGVYVVAFSSWLRVRQVDMSGVNRADPAALRAIAEAEQGRAMALVDVDALALRIAQAPAVRKVDVRRHWPQTLAVTVYERVPVAAIPAGDRFQLVDVDGVVVETMSRRPGTLPVIRVDLGQAGAATMRSALGVQEGLGETLAAQVTALGGDSPDAITLTLRNGAKVLWGDASSSELKNDALRLVAVAHPKAERYDVSAPHHPSASQGEVGEPLALGTP